jgi:uncharacterized protein YgiM (DUF1202 family)
MRFSKSLCLTVVLSLTLCSFAADSNSVTESNTASMDTATAEVSFPYIGEVTGVDVYIRSGPGTNYYRCGKLNAPEKVEVVGSENSWSKIVPPAGCFSWVSKQYVALNADNPGQGHIIGDNVNVRAGSEFVPALQSASLQTQLSKGTKIKLLGEEMDEYYKIVPPEGAYLWVSSEFLKNAGPVGKSVGFVTADGNTVEPNAMPKTISVESEKLKEYRQLSRQVALEHAKPVADQNWTQIKTKLAEIADNNDAGKAARYAKLQLENVKGFELARESGKELQQQHSQLTQTREQIEKQRQDELAKLGDLGKFAIVGKIRPSLLYAKSSKDYRYLVLNDSGRIIAYALPAESAANMDLSQFFGKKVGLVGKIERDPQTSSALIRFTEVVEMK